MRHVKGFRDTGFLLPGMRDTIHYTSRDMGSIFLPTFRDMGYLGKLIIGIFVSLHGILACLLQGI